MKKFVVSVLVVLGLKAAFRQFAGIAHGSMPGQPALAGFPAAASTRSRRFGPHATRPASRRKVSL
jgi:hypothetical protein